MNPEQTIPEGRPRGVSVAQLVRFAVVGASTTVLYLGLAFGLSALGLPALSASVLAYGICIAVSYAGQAGWTFGARLLDGAQAARFVATSLGGLLLSALSVLAAARLGFPPYAGFLAAAVLVPGLSLFLMGVWVFGLPRRNLAAKADLNRRTP